jgi:hypothetical protein
MTREIDHTPGAGNPTLAELIGDPLIRLMMQSDGVDPKSLETLFERVNRGRARALLLQTPRCC